MQQKLNRDKKRERKEQDKQHKSGIMTKFSLARMIIFFVTLNCN